MLLIDRDFGLLGEFVEVVRRETLRFCCIGSIHVDRGSLFRCLLRNAALGDLETALDRRAQKRVPDARSLTERFDAYLKALRHCRISIRSMTAVWSRPVIRRCRFNVCFGPLYGLESDISRGPRSAITDIGALRPPGRGPCSRVPVPCYIGDFNH